MAIKSSIDELAMWGGSKLFDKPVSTSNLVKPDVQAFLALLQSGLTDGGEAELIEQLEAELSHFHQCHHVVTVCSGFWALVLAIKALALPGKTEVVMPSLTYRRLADVVAWTGLIPRFCEVDEHSLAISAATAQSHINEHTALIIGVHPIVNCCDAPGLEALADAHKLPILFDGVESVYESINGQKIGSFGQAECFSFHASKLINGFEGGYITTQSAELASRLRAFRRGMDGGMQAALPAVHAAMALQGLRQIQEQIEHNRAIYYTYRNKLPQLEGLELLEFNESNPTSYKNIVVRLTEAWPLTRNFTIQLLNAEGILSRAYYSPPLHQKPMAYPAKKSHLPFTEAAAEQYMLMPCGDQVQTNDVDQVISFLKWMSANHAAISARQKEH